MQADRAERRRSRLEAPDELGGQVLGLGGAAAVADGQQPAAVLQPRRQARAPLLGAGESPRSWCSSARAAASRCARRRLARAKRPPPRAPAPDDELLVEVEGRERDAIPVVELPRAAHAGAALRRAAGIGSASSIAQHRGQAHRIARRDVAAGHAVDDGVDHPADRAGDDRHAAGHRLQRRDAERLVPRHGDQRVGGAQQRGQVVATDAAAQEHAVTDAVALGQRTQTPCLGVGCRSSRGRWPPATTSSQPGDRLQRADDVADALALDQPARVEDPVVAVRAARRGRRAGSARGRRRRGRRGPCRGRRRGASARKPRRCRWRRSGRRLATIARSTLQPPRGAGVGVALVAALDDAERVEGVDYRDVEHARRSQRREARHPEVAVDDVGPILAPSALQLGGEGIHVAAAARPCRPVAAGPASTWSTSTPGPSATRRGASGRRGACGRRRVAPRRASPRASARRGRSGRPRRRRRGRRAG